MTVTPITKNSAEPQGKREGTEARRSRDIIRLLDQHRELRGVHAMADLIDDAVRWTA